MIGSLSKSDRPVDFGSGEVTGAIGDSITVIPLVVALALLTDVSLPHALAAFGAFQIVWGVRYGLPISVEPMKALAALAIAGALTYAELALAGIILGAVLLAIGLSGTLGYVERWIGEPVIRGVQFAVGLVLLETGLRLAADDPLVALVGVAIAGGFALTGHGKASALAVALVGVAAALVVAGVPSPRLPGAPPTPAFGAALTRATVDGVVAQLAMTIGNAALATALLFSDLLDADVTPDELSTSMGVTNLIAVPLGGVPMCHGCDGVAGKHAFGARTGGANLVLGGGYLVAALFATPALIAAFPLAMLGALLAVVAVSLARNVTDSGNRALSVGIGLLALATNLGVAFLVGIAVHLAWERVRVSD
ncbi:putative sulfate/molybdate transporter [Halorubrum ezzemoulense]|uniref:putative sulfate/molybdate transporter n=1 Tax=Halorubrum ezzemoulense TaxID=337243 RepID=UPI00232B065A|nr:putative sulfate/molybdate transporter [Halorubrum ezzemoulense]MDB2224053.1 putative sulfate/molybdate transporter [Halorubrum ezzemoulense]MDB2269411.1 putative sulfate/molybdate transporter [Halorubrum ezzemoulense]MDB2274810.1 putative sulfate/molybdate transporter [Halorubrum ezzemoulense]